MARTYLVAAGKTMGIHGCHVRWHHAQRPYFVGEPQNEEFPITQAEAAMLPEEEWENMIRRTLVDDYAIYEYLTQANNNH